MSKSKEKGTSWETEVVNFLLERIPGVERKSLHGSLDLGDITGVEDWTLECKNEKKMNLAGAVDEARVEAANAHTSWFAAIIKRPRKNVYQAYAVIPLDVFRDLLVVHMRTRIPAKFPSFQAGVDFPN